MTKRRLQLVSTALGGAFLFVPGPVNAHDGEVRPGIPNLPAREKSVSTVEWASLGASLAVNAGLILVARPLAPKSCRWCEFTGSGENDLNRFDAGIRNHLRWQHPQRGHIWSNVAAMGALPVLALGLPTLWMYTGNAKSDLTMRDGWQVAKAVSLTLVFNQITKNAVGRDRPFVHAQALDPATPSPYASSHSDHLSFFSGHTAVAFALATSASVVAHRRFSPVHAAFVTGSTFFCASATAWLRVAADKHYATDVLTGALVGSALGLATTLSTRTPERRILSVAPGRQSLAFSFAGHF